MSGPEITGSFQAFSNERYEIRLGDPGQEFFRRDVVRQAEHNGVIGGVHLHIRTEPLLPGGLQGHGVGPVYLSSPTGMNHYLIAFLSSRSGIHMLDQDMMSVRQRLSGLRPEKFSGSAENCISAQPWIKRIL